MGDIGNVVLWAALIQGLLLALLYICSKKHRSRANFLLGCFLISIVLEALTVMLPMRTIGRYAIDTYFSLPEVKLFIPLLFLNYVLEKIGSTHKYGWFLKFNYFLAFAIVSLTLCNLYLFFFQNTSLNGLLGTSEVEQFHLAQQGYAFVLLLFAFMIAIKETLAYRKLARDQYSDFKMIQINWLWQFIFMLLPASVLWGMEIARILFIGPGEDDFVTIIWGCVVVFLYFLSYKAFLHPNLFDKVPLKAAWEKAAVANPYHWDEKQCETIERFMRDRELFLDPDLTLNLFAQSIEMSPRSISNCINKKLGNNFNEWVNGYRVERALKLIKQDVKNQLSIEGMGIAAGFKSRSTMYAAFQKKLGRSPGHYRGN